MSDFLNDNKADEMETEKERHGGAKWLIALLAVLFIAGGGLFALSHMNFLGDFVRQKAEEMAEDKLGVSLTMSGILGNPVTGFTASDIEISRSGDRLISIRNLGVDISLTSLLHGSPRLSLVALDGVRSSVADVEKLIPKTEKKSDGPIDIPVDTLVISDSSLETEWGELKLESGNVDIGNSENFSARLKGTLRDVPISVSGALQKIKGLWTAEDVAVGVRDGSANLSGALYPSPDVKISIRELNLSSVAELLPELESYGVRGVLSGSAILTASGDSFITEGSGSLFDAVVKGIPLEKLDTKWSYRPGDIKVEVAQGKIFDSTLTGSFELETRSGDRYMKLAADIKNLKFADWTTKFEKETAGRAIFLKGGISSLSADLEGPVNALKGSIKLAPSDVAYKDIALKALGGAVLFKGRPAGELNVGALADGRKLTLRGTLSFGEKAPTDLTFSAEGYPVEKILKSFPQTEKMKVTGIAALNGSCKGLPGGWSVRAAISSPQITLEKIGRISDIKATGVYDTAGKALKLENASAEWNGARITAGGSYLLSASEDKKLELKGTFKNAELERFYELVPVLRTLDAEGRGSGGWSVSGSPSSLQVGASVNVGAGRFRDLKIASLQTDVSFSENSLRLAPMKVQASGGHGLLNCDIRLPETKADGTKSPASWSLSGDVTRVDFSIINGLLKASEDISGEVSGKVKAASAEGGGLDWSFDFNGTKIAWREFRADSLTGLVEGTPDEILLKNIKGLFLGGDIAGGGRIEMPADGRPFSESALGIEMSIEKLNIYELLRRHLPAVRSVQGLIESKLKVEGKVGDPSYSGTARIAPFRYRGFMLPMVDLNYRGSLKKIVVSEGRALLRDGDFKSYGHFYEEDGEWYGDFSIKGANVMLRQFGAYLPEGFRARLGGAVDFAIKGKGKLSDIAATGSITSQNLTLMGINFENVSAPFYISKSYMIVEDLKAATNGGALSGGVGFDLDNSEWGGNLTVTSTDVAMLMKQAAPDIKGSVSGVGDLKIRGGGETGRLSTIKAGGALYLRNGEVTSFDAIETAKKFTGGKPLRFSAVTATFTYDGGDFNLLPGSQAVAPVGDPIYRYVMLDGTVNQKKELSFFAMGKVNIRALNSLIGAFQGIVSAGMDLVSGEVDRGELLQNVLGGVLSGFAKNEFRFITMNIGGTTAKPQFYNVKVARAMQQSSAKDNIPISASDPNEKNLLKDGNTTFRFKFEIPMGPGDDKTRGDAKGQVVEQTLENLLKNIDFGL
ncbi:MAG: hypothetical protein Q4D58_02320 [Synergistaceae bacterium]|nr:hypothetical protein [Synergistaceae bacterium]